MELSQQLAIIMVGKQVINNAQEILWPKAQAWWQNRKVNNTFVFRHRPKLDLFLIFYKTKKMDFTQDKNKSKQWENDYQLVDNSGLFQEYLEMGTSSLGDKFQDLTDKI